MNPNTTWSLRAYHEVTAGAALQQALHLRACVRAATRFPEDTVIEGPIRCWRAPGGAACPGRPAICRFQGAVRWVCPLCGDAGEIRDWEDSPEGRHPAPEPLAPMHRRTLRGPVSSWPKISGVLMKFARPLLDQLPPNAEAWTRALTVPIAAWNAVVFADFADDPSVLEACRQSVAAAPYPSLAFEMFVSRKRRLFAPDWRAITLENLEFRGDEVTVHASARDIRPAGGQTRKRRAEWNTPR